MSCWSGWHYITPVEVGRPVRNASAVCRVLFHRAWLLEMAAEIVEDLIKSNQSNLITRRS